MGNKKGGGDPPELHPAEEYRKIFNIFQKQVLPGYRQFRQREPLLRGLNQLAQQGMNQLPALQQLLTQSFGQRTPVGQLRGPLLNTYRNQIAPILASGGALTGQLSRQASQDALKYAGAAGMANTSPALFAAALNRDVYRQNRYNTALNQALQVAPGIQGLEGTDWQRTLGYAMGQQGLRGSTMQDLAAAEGAQTGAFSSLFGPTSAGVGSMLNFNANAQAAAQNAQSQKKGNTTGAVIGAIGSVAAAY